jgi:hypothetical protein
MCRTCANSNCQSSDKLSSAPLLPKQTTIICRANTEAFRLVIAGQLRMVLVSLNLYSYSVETVLVLSVQCLHLSFSRTSLRSQLDYRSAFGGSSTLGRTRAALRGRGCGCSNISQFEAIQVTSHKFKYAVNSVVTLSNHI